MAAARDLMGGTPLEQCDSFFAAIGAPDRLQKLFKEKAEVDVYPENWPAVEVFSSVMTQWRIGMSGPTGLDYAVLPGVMEMIGIGRKDRRDVFDGVRVMESEALKVLSEKRNGR
jgi:hypothetical protein